MRLHGFIITILLFMSIFSMAHAQPVEDVLDITYDGEFIGFSIPDGWRAAEVRQEVYQDLLRFDDMLLGAPIEVTPDDDTAGLMVLASGRGDGRGTLYDFILLTKAENVEIFELYGEGIELTDAGGGKHEAYLKIDTLDDGVSSVMVCHDLMVYVGGMRIEFAYIAPIEEYGPNFDGVESILASVEFK